MNENEGVRSECVNYLNVRISDIWKRIAYKMDPFITNKCTFPQKREN